MAMDFKKPTADQVQQFESALPSDPRVKRVKMFGLPHGKVGDHMFAGRHGTGVTVRLPPGDRDKLLAQGSQLFEPMPGRPMKDWVLLSPAITGDAKTLSGWVKRAFEHTASLPPKGKKPVQKPAAKPATRSKSKSKPVSARSKRA
ncbi:MAG TPA: TfoX/Sxy family protein [Myxococcales bacterium]|jgi:hypothetical protein|nr:TfoX/Sxy family protein [Myxococcales bacterium]